MLTIRLTRIGKKNSPAYRVVVADKKRAVKRKFIEIIGSYNPTVLPKDLKIKKDRALFWISQGAQLSDTVNNLMCDLEILDKKDKIKKIYGKKMTKKEIKEGAGKAPVEAKGPEEAVVAIEDQAPETEEEVETPSETPETETPVEEVAPETVETETEAVETTPEEPKEETKE